MPFVLHIHSNAFNVFLQFTRTDSNKFFSVSRSSSDLLGGLAAIFFAAYSRLSRRRLSKIFAACSRL